MMSGTTKDLRGTSFGSSRSSSSDGHPGGDRGGGEGGRGRGGSVGEERIASGKKDGPIAQDKPHSLTYEGLSQINLLNQSKREPENERQMKKESEEDHEKDAVAFAQTSTMSDAAGSKQRRSPGPRQTYPYQQQHEPAGNSEGMVRMTRTFAAKGRAVNHEVELGTSYSHYPTSDTRTEEDEASHETNSLVGSGFNNRVSSGRGRIWEEETRDGWKGKNRTSNREPELIPLRSSSAIPQWREKEAQYPSTSPRTTRSAELSVPVSKVREGNEEEDNSYSHHSYSSSAVTNASIAQQHNGSESGSIAATQAAASSTTTSSRPSTVLPSISRVEGNSSTPSVPRARKESVSGSSSPSAITHVSTYPVSQNRYSSEHVPKRSSSPSIVSSDYSEETRQKQSWSGTGGFATNIHHPHHHHHHHMSSRDTYRRDDPAAAPSSSRSEFSQRMRAPDPMAPFVGVDSDPTYQTQSGRSHVSRSPDRSYFQNSSTSAARSGNTSSTTNAVFHQQGTMATMYQNQQQQQDLKEPRHHYHSSSSETHSYPSPEQSRIRSPLLPPTYIHTGTSRPDNSDSVGGGGTADRIYLPSGSGGKNIGFERHHHLARSKQNSPVDSRLGHARRTSSTPPTPESRDPLRQAQQRTYAEYQKPGSRQSDRERDMRMAPAQEQESIITTDFAHNSTAAGRIGGGVLGGVIRSAVAGLSDLNTNPPSKAASSYSTPSSASVTLSPIQSRPLPSLRETFASPTMSTEPLPPLPRNLTSTSLASSSSAHLPPPPPQTVVSIPPAQVSSGTISSSSRLSAAAAPGGPWLYDGEEPDLEEDENFAVAEEGGPPKKRRRTRVALSCAECKRRKIKCDRAQPCTPCSRRGDQSNCKWAVMETKDGTPTRAEFEALQTRVAKLERLLDLR